MIVGHPVFWVMLAAVVAPLLAALPTRLKLPVVVLEVVLGILIGPHMLRLVEFDGFVATMFPYAMATTLFMAGMELDFAKIRGRPLQLAFAGWGVSLLLGVLVVAFMHAIPRVDAPLIVVLALCTTGLGVLIPVFGDAGHLDTAFGRLFMAAGTVGEVGPVIAMSLLLSSQYTTWQEFGFLFVFLAIVASVMAAGLGARNRCCWIFWAAICTKAPSCRFACRSCFWQLCSCWLKNSDSRASSAPLLPAWWSDKSRAARTVSPFATK